MDTAEPERVLAHNLRRSSANAASGIVAACATEGVRNEAGVGMEVSRGGDMKGRPPGGASWGEMVWINPDVACWTAADRKERVGTDLRRGPPCAGRGSVGACGPGGDLNPDVFGPDAANALALLPSAGVVGKEATRNALHALERLHHAVCLGCKAQRAAITVTIFTSGECTSAPNAAEPSAAVNPNRDTWCPA